MKIELFGADYCAGCKVVEKVLTQREVAFDKLNIDNSEVMEQAMQLGIRQIPVTVFTFENGRETVVGASKEAIDRIIEIVQ